MSFEQFHREDLSPDQDARKEMGKDINAKVWARWEEVDDSQYWEVEKKDPKKNNEDPNEIKESLWYARTLKAANLEREANALKREHPTPQELLAQVWIWTQINALSSSDATKSAGVEWANWETLSA